jgi:uncharacterized DUF497 family protein
LLWKSQYVYEEKLNYKEEARFKNVGFIGEKLWTAIITHRNGKLRIISVRHPRKDEIESYERDK